MSDKLQKLKDVLALLQNDTISPKQLEQFLKTMITAMKQATDNFKSLTAKELTQLQNVLTDIQSQHSLVLSKVDQMNKKAAGYTDSRIDGLMATVKQVQATRGEDGAPGTPGQDGAPGKDGSPDSGEDIIQKLNDLSTEDDQLKIDAAHIKNLPVARGGIVHGGIRNTRIYSGSTLIAKALQALEFTGAGVTATVTATGVVVVTIPGGSSSLTAADQDAIDSGDHTTFTISHTPVANTLLVINENNGQAIPAAAYTNTGTSIIFNASQQVDDGTGNLVTPTFRARYFF